MVEQRRKPNRAERRRMEKELRLQHKKMFKPQIELLISCPDCGSTNIKQIRHEYFKCDKCGAEHPLPDMACEL